MIETNKQTNEKHLFCDRCQKELTDKVVVYQSGDCLCEKCFDNEHKIISVDEYLKDK